MQAYMLNTPLWAVILKKPDFQAEDGPLVSPIIELPPLSWIIVDCPNVVVTAFKRSEKFETIYILRVAEQRGMTSCIKI